MKILPPVLIPWRAAVERRHEPPVAEGRYGYRAYRSCLRWEFGFTCPFCLCHETDLAQRGTEGLGVTQVEHFVPVSHEEARANRYSNCFYVCRFCNQARGSTSNVDSEGGKRLLNPCADVWAEHFLAIGGGIRAQQGDGDAAYTHATYQLNDPRKVARRSHRRETIEECLALLEQGSSLLPRLLKLANERNEPDLVEEARVIAGAIRRAWQDLQDHAVLPVDAPQLCACGADEHCVIPPLLDEQTIEVDSPFKS